MLVGLVGVVCFACGSWIGEVGIGLCCTVCDGCSVSVGGEGGGGVVCGGDWIGNNKVEIFIFLVILVTVILNKYEMSCIIKKEKEVAYANKACCAI